MWTLFRPSYVKLCKVFIHVLKFSIFPVSSFPPSLGPMMCPHKIWHLSGAHKYVHRGTLNTQKRIFSITIPHLLQLYRHVALCVFSHLFICIDFHHIRGWCGWCDIKPIWISCSVRGNILSSFYKDLMYIVAKKSAKLQF